MADRWRNNGNSDRFNFGGLQNHSKWWLQPWNEKTLTPWKKSYDQLDTIFKSRDITLPTTFHLVKVMVFPIVMYGCESWTIKKAECQWIDAFELWCWRRLLRVPCTAIFIGRTNVEAETPTLWPPDAKSWLIWEDPDTGKDWRQEKGMTEYEMVGWHHQLGGHEFEQALGVDDGQGGLAWCSPWGHKESETTGWLNWTELNSAYKLNKQGDNIPPWHTSFPILNQYVVPCLVVTIASWPAYRFLRRLVRLLVA